MFAISRSKRPIFVAPRRRTGLARRVTSYLTLTGFIALSTWGGVLLARWLGGSEGMDSPLARAIDRLVNDLLRLNPALSAAIAGLAGLVGLAFFLRDHH